MAGATRPYREREVPLGKIISSFVPNGLWTIYHKPLPGYYYGIGGDSASGIPGRNGSALHVVNFNLHRLEAVLAGNVSPEVLAQEADKAGRWYNNALIAIEAMYHGLVVNYKLMEDLNYPNLYQHDGSFTKTQVRLSSEVGWRQTEQNRNLLLSLLQTDLSYNLSKDVRIRSQALLCADIPTLQECTHFHRNPKGKAEAEKGFADDRVMSCGIANALYHTMKRSLPIPEPEKKKTEWEKWQELKDAEQTRDNFALGEYDIENRLR